MIRNVEKLSIRQNKFFQNEIVGRATTRQNAEKWETNVLRLQKYHGGRNSIT